MSHRGALRATRLAHGEAESARQLGTFEGVTGIGVSAWRAVEGYRG